MKDVKDLQVVILCGGQGTRMREETEFRPKALVEVGGRPVLWHLMRHYYHFGYRRFVLCLGYRGSMIKEYFLSYRWMNEDFTLKFGAGEPQVVPHGSEGEDRVTDGPKSIDNATFFARLGRWDAGEGRPRKAARPGCWLPAPRPSS